MGSPGRVQRLSRMAVIVAASLIAFHGCKSGGEGPMERGGKAVDRAGEKIGDVFRK